MFSIQRIRRSVLAVACTVAAAFLLTAPASARADDTYAAIAYSPKTGAYGFGDKYDSRKGAEEKALAECKGDDALVVVWVKNGWCAWRSATTPPCTVGATATAPATSRRAQNRGGGMPQGRREKQPHPDLRIRRRQDQEGVGPRQCAPSRGGGVL